MSKKLYSMECGCKDVVYEYNYSQVKNGSICVYCNNTFRKVEIVRMEQTMLMQPELKMGMHQHQVKEMTISVFPSIEVSNINRTYYSYSIKTGAVSKKKQRIVSEDRNRTLDVFEFITRNK